MRTNGSGYAFRNPDVLLDRLGRFQIHRVGRSGRFQSDGRLASMQHLCDIGANVCRSVGLEGGDQERKTAFRGATERKSWLISVNLPEGCHGGQRT